ncbi:MAG: DUF3343 domain-containing protein [Defluviitaleaceae bacterium]|nr:DUF3343 domain-containing protein [Defluviitaleaceae bacterium]
MEFIIAFETTNCAIFAEDILLAAGLRPKVMPLPPEIRAGCGIALRLSSNEIDSAKDILTKNGISFEITSKL